MIPTIYRVLGIYLGYQLDSNSSSTEVHQYRTLRIPNDYTTINTTRYELISMLVSLTCIQLGNSQLNLLTWPPDDSYGRIVATVFW